MPRMVGVYKHSAHIQIYKQNRDFQRWESRPYFLQWGLCYENCGIKGPIKDFLLRWKINILFDLQQEINFKMERCFLFSFVERLLAIWSSQVETLSCTEAPDLVINSIQWKPSPMPLSLYYCMWELLVRSSNTREINGWPKNNSRLYGERLFTVHGTWQILFIYLVAKSYFFPTSLLLS